MHLVSLLAIGFSLGAALLLIAGYVLQRRQPMSLTGILAGLCLIIGLAAIQGLNLEFLSNRFDGPRSLAYLLLLFSIAPSFYFYSRQALTGSAGYCRRDLLHVFGFVPCLLLPYPLALPAAFLLGGGYLLWLARILFALRRQRARFRLELLALTVLFGIATAVVALGFVWPLLSETDFIASYSILIGLAFFAVTLTLLRFPGIGEEVSEAVRAAYAESTLKNVDKPAVLARLDALMQHDRLYTLETLNLAVLAEQLQLSEHQLSELINTEFQQGFPRYIRQQRVEEAKRLLLADPRASVLSIGLSVGFGTQSNFYAAFRDIAGVAPGQYRKLHGRAGKSDDSA